jgi:hypothetical protein
MADGAPTATAPKFSKTKPPQGAPADSTATLHLILDPLESIYVYADELLDPAKNALKNRQGGSVTFVTRNGSKVPVRLLKTWFPAGTWGIDIDSKGKIAKFKPLFPENVPQPVLDTINRHSGEKDFVLQWQQTRQDAAAIKALIAGAAGRTIRLVVSYSKAKGGNAKSLPDTLPLTASDISPLSDPTLAELYLQFVEHFGNIPVDFSLAKDGLTRAELDQVEKNRPAIIAITDLFLQGFGEFKPAKDSASPPADLDAFRAMEEAIFNQKKNNNDLARRNMLMIGMGNLLFTTEDGKKDLRPDIGVLRRTVNGGARLLLYDRFGNAVRGVINGFLDTEFRSTDLTKLKRDAGIPFLTIEVENQALYDFLRSIEQNLGQPVREIEALAASYYKYSVFINNEIHRRYNGEIGKRFLACAPVVIGFFVAHAIASYLVTVNPPVGLAVMALLQAGGLVLGFDAVLMDMGLLMQAGRHFAQMEQLHREAKDAGDPRLTRLSEAHLKAGAEALIDAMADIIVVGVLIVGQFAIAKAGPALARGIRNRAQARLKITVENDTATKIETIDPMKEIKTAEPAPETGAEKGGLGANEPTPGAGDPKGTKPIEHPDAYHGDGLEGKTPRQQPFTPKRPKALDQTPEDFAKNTPEQNAVQKELFDSANQAVARQNAFIRKILGDLKIKGADAGSILKRDGLADFTTKVIEKILGRKDYKSVAEMTDMIRGRVNVDDPADVARVVQAIMGQAEVSVKSVKEPSARVGVEDGYPRFHIDVIDPDTGIVHEWQIGTKQTTKLFQDPGIDPAGLDIAPENTNIHDIEYDIFKSIDEPGSKRSPQEQAELKALAAEFGIAKFRKKVAELAARTGNEKVPPDELEAQIKELHAEAGRILKGLIDRKGKDFVQHFLH